MALRQRAPVGTLIAALACFALAFALWRTAGRWRKSFLPLAMLVVTFSAVMVESTTLSGCFIPSPIRDSLRNLKVRSIPKKWSCRSRLGDDARAYPDQPDGLPSHPQ